MGWRALELVEKQLLQLIDLEEDSRVARLELSGEVELEARVTAGLARARGATWLLLINLGSNRPWNSGAFSDGRMLIALCCPSPYSTLLIPSQGIHMACSTQMGAKKVAGRFTLGPAGKKSSLRFCCDTAENIYA